MTEKGTCDDCAFRKIPRDQPNGRKCDDCGAFADYKNWELLEGRTKGYPNNVDDMLEWAWCILANVSGGRWSLQSEDWVVELPSMFPGRVITGKHGIE